jgi:signal transduction histidine kinase
MKPLLEEIAAEASANGASVELECPEQLSVVAHVDLLRQAIENLVSNAFKYGGRELEISAKELSGERVRIEVADHGKGLDPEQRDRAFDRFFRVGGRDEDGFGLGLPIVREVISALAGEVEIDSAPGRGTRVSIVLPRGNTIPGT